jgi:uncharacterized membrane protein HdeD (DUF308 family)
MKSSTLIVRLLGLYFVFQGFATFYQFWRLDRHAALLAQTPLASEINNLLIFQIFVFVTGLILTAKAGRMAELLTFDADR